MDALAEGSALDTEDVAASICDAFWDRCERFGTEASATLSAIDLSAMDVVGEALDAAIDACGDPAEPKRALRRSQTARVRRRRSAPMTTRASNRRT